MKKALTIIIFMAVTLSAGATRKRCTDWVTVPNTNNQWVARNCWETETSPFPTVEYAPANNIPNDPCGCGV